MDRDLLVSGWYLLHEGAPPRPFGVTVGWEGPVTFGELEALQGAVRRVLDTHGVRALDVCVQGWQAFERAIDVQVHIDPAPWTPEDVAALAEVPPLGPEARRFA